MYINLDTYVYTCIYTYAHMYVLVISQFEYNILVITQVRGEAKDTGDN